MVINLEEYKIKKFIKKILPDLAPIQSEKIPLREVEKKLEELFKEAKAEDMSGKLFWVSEIFKGWLISEKKLSFERATELSNPLYMAMGKKMSDETQPETEVKESKILPFKKIR